MQKQAEAATRGSSVQQPEAAHNCTQHEFTSGWSIDQAGRHNPNVGAVRRRWDMETTSLQDTTRKNYPSPSRRLSGSRADTSGPSSLLNCAFQSDPLNNMNRPATRRGNMRVATAQMP